MTASPAEEVLRGWLADTAQRVRGQRRLAERALAQVSDDDFFRTLDSRSNSLALLVKHLTGNMRSRFTDFLTSDGEKPDRNRDAEFLSGSESRTELMRAWDQSWEIALTAIEALDIAAPGETITIASEPHTVAGAVTRHLAHAAYHTGQIALLAKHWCGAGWKTLSIARDGSTEYYAALRRETEGGR